jgi:hypothetical protein
MDFKIEIIKELQWYDNLYKNAKINELQKGFEISKTIKEFDSPEDFLNENDLFLLSQFYAYRNIEESKNIDGEDYVFDDEDL